MFHADSPDFAAEFVAFLKLRSGGADAGVIAAAARLVADVKARGGETGASSGRGARAQPVRCAAG
jgi:hypothetical protein